MIIAYSTLRHTFDHLYPIVEALRDRGQDARVVSTWKGATWADHVMTPAEIAALPMATTFLVASSSDAAALEPREVIYVERGTGQTYDADARTYESNSYSTGRIPNARLFLCPNRFVGARRQARHPDALAIVTGAAKLDEYHHMRGFHPGVHRQMVAFAFGQIRKDAVTVVEETRGAFDHYKPRLKHIALTLRRMGFYPVATAHPRSAKRVQYHTERSGFEWMESGDVLRQAAILVADNTSLMYEFAALDRPVVCLDAPWWRREVHHGLRFYECIPGYVTGNPDDVPALVQESAHDDWPEARECAAMLYERFDGKAAVRSAQAVEMLAAVTA